MMPDPPPLISNPPPKIITLGKELTKATVGAITAGLGAFTGTITLATASDTKALSAAGVAAGFTALVFFSNSLNAWYNQQN